MEKEIQRTFRGVKQLKNLYSFSAIEQLWRETLEPLGYEWVQLRDGVLGIGDIVFIAPDNEHYHYVVREVYLNEWSSAQTIRRCSKISKAIQREIDAYEKEVQENAE